MKIYTLVHWDAEDLHRQGPQFYQEMKLEAPRLYATFEKAMHAGKVEANSYAETFQGIEIWQGEYMLDDSNTPDDMSYLQDLQVITRVWHYKVMQDAGESDLGGTGKASTCIAEFRIYELEVYQ